MYIGSQGAIGQTDAGQSLLQTTRMPLFQRIRTAVQRGKDAVAISLAVNAGVRDENKITNFLFWARHPERWGHGLRRDDPDFKRLSREWSNIRDTVVSPALKRMAQVSTPVSFPAPSAVGDEPDAPFGTLVANVPGRAMFRYAFTPKDVIWTARLLVGEAGGRDDPPNRAVLWAMLNRYALFTHRNYRTFHDFLRSYSTPLQPVLRSAAAAERAIYNSRAKPGTFQFVPDPSGAMYPGTNIPKGQYQHHLVLQRSPWRQLPLTARSLAEGILKGQVDNPGIGPATDFANTDIILKQNVRLREGKARDTTAGEWIEFTKKYRQKEMRWIGDVAPDLKQRAKNAFFVRLQALSYPRDSVRVLAPET